jgi:L-asparaginase
LQRLGALDGFDLTPEAAFARMHYLLATCENKKAVAAAWPQPLCGEFTVR